MKSAPLWRGYWLLFASTSAAALIMQIDLARVARLGRLATGAYAILMRITPLAIALGEAQRIGETPVEPAGVPLGSKGRIQ